MEAGSDMTNEREVELDEFINGAWRDAATNSSELTLPSVKRMNELNAITGRMDKKGLLIPVLCMISTTPNWKFTLE